MEGKKQKQGAPQGNLNATTQGAYIQLAKRTIDGRTHLGKQLKILKQELITDLGGDVTRAQDILIDRIKFKVASLHFIEQAMARGEINVTDRYIALSNSLRQDLLALGLDRKQKDYLSYLDEIKSQEGKK